MSRQLDAIVGSSSNNGLNSGTGGPSARPVTEAWDRVTQGTHGAPGHTPRPIVFFGYQRCSSPHSILSSLSPTLLYAGMYEYVYTYVGIRVRAASWNTIFEFARAPFMRRDADGSRRK